MSKNAYISLCTWVALALFYTGCSSSPDQQTYGQAQYGADKVSDVAKPKEALIHYGKSMILGSPNAWVGRLVYECSEDVPYMWDFMQAEMKKLGWTQLSGVRSSINTLIFKRGARVASVQIQSRFFPGSIITVEIAPEASSEAGNPQPNDHASGDYQQFAPLPQTSFPPTSSVQDETAYAQPIQRLD